MINKTADITFAINIFLVNFWLKKSIINLAKSAIKFMKFAAFRPKAVTQSRLLYLPTGGQMVALSTHRRT